MSITTVGIVGAGTMGNGIAQACAVSGINVVMVDIAQAAPAAQQQRHDEKVGEHDGESARGDEHHRGCGRKPADGDEQRAMLMGAKRFTKGTNLNTAELRKLVAKRMIAEGKYCY